MALEEKSKRAKNQKKTKKTKKNPAKQIEKIAKKQCHLLNILMSEGLQKSPYAIGKAVSEKKIP